MGRQRTKNQGLSLFVTRLATLLIPSTNLTFTVSSSHVLIRKAMQSCNEQVVSVVQVNGFKLCPELRPPKRPIVHAPDDTAGENHSTWRKTCPSVLEISWALVPDLDYE
jgi:hypothetical protein